MIGWYIDVGYSTSAQFNALSNISQFIVLDENKPFTIGTVKNSSSISEGSMTVFTGDIGSANVDRAIALIESAIGDDFFTIYGLYTDSYNVLNLKEKWDYIMPSGIKAYPNTINYFGNSTGARPLVPLLVHFKSIHRLVAFFNNNQNLNFCVYNVNTNGHLALIGSGTSNTRSNSNRIGQSISFPVLIGTNKSEVNSYSMLVILIGLQGLQTMVNLQVGFFDVPSCYLTYIFDSNQPPDIVGPIPPDNPYEPGGDSGEGGGGGSFDDDSDPIPDSSLPTLSSAATGFTRIYNPTLGQLNQLAAYLWTDESVIQTIWNHAKQFFEDPMSVIIGLNIVPVPVPNGGTDNFRVLYIDTGIPLTYAASQFVDVDCGTLEIKRYYGSALDQAPYTKISCFLPFIGTVQLNTDEVMGATLQVKYRVDICSGSCVAKIFVDGNCIYQYSGHCAVNVPVSSADFSSYVSAAISVAKLAIGAAVGGGMTALAAAGTDPIQHTNNTTTIKTTNTERNPATGRQITMGTQTQTIESVQERPTTMASFSGLTPANVSNTVGEIMTAKPHVEHSGSFSGNTGYLGVRRPFVIIERPNMCMPASYQQLNGFPCMITLELAECSGFTKVQQVQLTGMSATNPEQAEILDLLKTGVII